MEIAVLLPIDIEVKEKDIQSAFETELLLRRGPPVAIRDKDSMTRSCP